MLIVKLKLTFNVLETHLNVSFVEIILLNMQKHVILLKSQKAAKIAKKYKAGIAMTRHALRYAKMALLWGKKNVMLDKN